MAHGKEKASSREQRTKHKHGDKERHEDERMGNDRPKHKRRSPSPRPIMTSERRKNDRHHAIEWTLKSIWDPEAKKKGDKAKKERHKNWAKDDERRAREIVAGMERRKSRRKSSTHAPRADDEPTEPPVTETKPSSQAPALKSENKPVKPPEAETKAEEKEKGDEREESSKGKYDDKEEKDDEGEKAAEEESESKEEAI